VISSWQVVVGSWILGTFRKELKVINSALIIQSEITKFISEMIKTISDDFFNFKQQQN
jgi:hypothetical protein